MRKMYLRFLYLGYHDFLIPSSSLTSRQIAKDRRGDREGIIAQEAKRIIKGVRAPLVAFFKVFLSHTVALSETD